jgi:outer membrane biosynthesis protein TonB
VSDVQSIRAAQHSAPESVIEREFDPELVRAAVEAVSKWRYSPILLNGDPIEVDTTVMANFKLLP